MASSGHTRSGLWGHGVLLAAGLALVGLMAYTLAWVGEVRSGLRHDGQADVAVFVPDRTDWVDVREGISACVRKGLVRLVREAGDQVIVETPVYRHPIRFTWRPVRGMAQTQSEVRRLAEQQEPPAAIVGSNNTVYTVALAEGLREAAKSSRRPGPALLVPWASSVSVDAEPTRGAESRVRLLDIDPGRTFRFCPNNQREADMIVDCLAAQQPKVRPARVMIVVDRNDPYSVDMAACFTKAIGAIAPKAEIVVEDSALGFPRPGNAPDPHEERWAERVWREARGATGRGPTWLVLPLQEEPAHRLLTALRNQAKSDDDGSDLVVLCGDGPGLGSLAEFAGNPAFPVWGISAASIPSPGAEARPGRQVLAEIVSAVAQVLDVPWPDGRPVDLAKGLAGLSIAAADPAAVAGRSLAFDGSGERRGNDLGGVLAVLPGHVEVIAYTRDAKGHWQQVRPDVEARR